VNKFLETFASQLYSIFLKRSEISNLPPGLFERVKHKVLVDITIDRLNVSHNWPYLRLADSASEENYIDAKLPPNISPDLLYFPLKLAKVNDVTSRFRQAMQLFLSDCAESKVEVVFEEHSNRWGVDSGFSEDFCRRMKENYTEQVTLE
jgi:hypothetical protein